MGWYLPTFKVSLNLAKKGLNYHQRKKCFWPKSVRCNRWSHMHIEVKGHSSNTYLHSKFHKCWSRNAQGMTCKHQTLMTEWKIETWVMQLPWGLLKRMYCDCNTPFKINKPRKWTLWHVIYNKQTKKIYIRVYLLLWTSN